MSYGDDSVYKLQVLLYQLYFFFYLHDSHVETKAGHGNTVSADYERPSPAAKVPHGSKTKHRLIKQADKAKVVKLEG